MSIIKEFREFFLRNTSVPSGTKPDQETGFPTQYQVEGNNVFNRFLKKNFPSENVFKKLFESIAFKLNVEDTSTSSQQGLVKQASTLEFNSGADNDTDGYALYATPSQIQAAITAAAYDDTAVLAAIAANTSNISTNATNIGTNTTDIGTNTANIGTNTGNITLLSAALGGTQTRVTDIENDINKQVISHATNIVSVISVTAAPQDVQLLVIDGANDHNEVFVTARLFLNNLSGAPALVVPKLKDHSATTVLDEAIITMPIGATMTVPLSGKYSNYVAGQNVRLTVEGATSVDASMFGITAMSKLDAV